MERVVISRSKLLRFAILWCLVGGNLRLNAEPAQTGPKDGTILIIRHGEKKVPEDKTDKTLTKTGDERAWAYVRYFSPFNDGKQDYKIDAVFAAAESDASNRPILTINRFVRENNVPHVYSIANEDWQKVIDSVKDGPYEGKTVLICWHHGNIHELIKGFGGHPNDLLDPNVKHGWPEDVFGWVVELKFDSTGSLKESRVIDEQLMNDDTTPPPHK